MSSPGEYVLAFSSLGADNNYVVVQGEGTLTITKADQTISVGPIGDKSIYAPPFSLQGSTTSDLPVSYSVLSGPATISGNMLTLTGETGMVEVEAAQAGDVNYFPAPPVVQSFSVRPDVQTGIEDGVAGSIDIWPNPASSIVVVKSKKNDIIKVSLLDLPGKAVYYDVDHKNECRLDTKSLTKGVYVMSITLDSGVTIFRRLIIN